MTTHGQPITPHAPWQAEGRAKWDAFLEELTRPVTDWLCDSARLVPGMRVLDVACGTAQPSLTAARRVQPGGSVLGIDNTPGMVEAARRLAAEASITNVTFEVMEGEELTLPDASFDAALCRWGVMYTIDAVKSAREVVRVLRPGGRYAVATWDDPALNPRHTIVDRLIERVLPPERRPQAPAASARRVFRFAEAAKLSALLTDAGFRNVACEPVQITYVFESADQYWLALNELWPNARIAGVAIEDRLRLREAFEAEVAQYRQDGGLRFTGSALCVCGERA